MREKILQMAITLIARTTLRVVRFYVHESLWWFAGFAVVLLYLAWRFSGKPWLLFSLYAGAIVFALLPRVFCRAIALRYDRVRWLLGKCTIAIVVVVIGLVHARYQATAAFTYTYYVAFYIGIKFWTVTDDLYEMLSWLSHPLEYARLPDEIHFLAQRYQDGTINRLWRYRYGDDWDIGITGFETFAFQDGRCNSMSPEQIFEQYRQWYDREGIESLREKALEE